MSNPRAQPTLAEWFHDPPTWARPHAYWWLPPLEEVTAAGVEREVEQVADAGIKGLLPYRRAFAMPSERAHLELLETALRTAQRRGITIDLSLACPASAPSIAPDDGTDQQELVYGLVHLEAGRPFTAALPAPPTDPAQRRTLVAVNAARRATDTDGERPILLDPEVLYDLTDAVRDGQLEWTAPIGDGRWLLLAFWSRSALGSSWTDGLPYADHLGTRGATAITEHLDTHTLTPEIAALLREAGGTLNENSLELSAFHLWSGCLLSEFERRRGYSLRPYLPVTVIANVNEFFGADRFDPFGMAVHTDSPADFDFPGEVGRRIRNDYYQTLSELYEQYLMTLQSWAHARGLQLQAKVGYGHTFSTAAAARIDVPTTETFQLANTLDGYRTMTGAVHLGGRERLSVECCPTLGPVDGLAQDNYAATWKRMLAQIHLAFAGGANEVNLHGVTYPTAEGATWPGYTSSDGESAEELGPRQPYWRHMPALTAYLGRLQLVLREGAPRVDVAVYRHSYWDYGFPAMGECPRPEGCLLINDPTLQRSGYTYEYIGPDLLELPGVEVEDGRLSRNGPGYRALVLHQGQRNSVDGMPLRTARTILTYARAGLPIVVVGQLPGGTGFFADRNDDPEVRQALATLLEQPLVRSVAGRARSPRRSPTSR